MTNEQLMQAYYAAYNSEDPVALRHFYADDVVLVSSQGETRGADELLAVYRYLTGQFRDQMTPAAISVDGDVVEVEISDRFTAKVDVADFLGMAVKQGETFELRLRGRYWLRDGKFQRIVIEQLA